MHNIDDTLSHCSDDTHIAITADCLSGSFFSMQTGERVWVGSRRANDAATKRATKPEPHGYWHNQDNAKSTDVASLLALGTFSRESGTSA
jgi:hypothetical protein